MHGFAYPGEGELEGDALEPEALPFTALAGFDGDDHLAAFRCFLTSATAIVNSVMPLRETVVPSAALMDVCRRALADPAHDGGAARAFFETCFTPHRLRATGFVTAYFEPCVEGGLSQSEDFPTPVYARPDDLVTLPQGSSLAGPDGPLQAARHGPQGLEPYPDRAAIESGALRGHAQPIVYLRDPCDLFVLQVQGSGRVRLREGGELRLTYAGRNGHPYTSIGRILVEEEKVPVAQAGLTGLKQWIRAKGQAPGEAGFALMLRNKSYIFFAATEVLAPGDGPIGGQGVPLTPLRSMALDRTIWPYGLPVWIEADIPWRSAAPEPFRRLMIGQDTGSAIVGPARGDLFFGPGETAGDLAGAIRHQASFTVLLPQGSGPKVSDGRA